jgi:hypothetical protein
METNWPNLCPVMGTTPGPDIVALLAQLNRKMDGLQGKIDGFQGKMDTFQDKLTSLKEHQQPANDSPTQPPEKPRETQECIIPGWNRQTSDSFIQTCMPYAWGTAKVVDKDLQIRPRFHQPSKGCSTDQGPC